MWEALESYVTSEDFQRMGISIIIFLLFLLFSKIFAKYIFRIILRITQKVPGSLFSTVTRAFEKPTQWLFIIIGLYFAVSYFPYIQKDNVLIIKFFRSSIIFLVGWGLFNLSGVSSSFFTSLKEKYNVHIDDLLIPILSKTCRVIIVALTIAIILEEFGYDVSTFVAGLGIGSLAFALAAKDTVANLFGGFVIITEKPFTIGDWILTPSVEGTVEDITFRSTKVRTFAQALVTVPNSTLANEPITNWTKMGKRRVSTRLCLPHNISSDKVERIVAKIEHLLRTHPDVHQDVIFVKFDEFKENGFDIMLYWFTKTTVWGEFLTVKQDVNLKILKILEEEQVTIALPVRKILSADEDVIRLRDR